MTTTGTPIMHQTWDKLLFLHWAFPESVLRPHVPAPLQIDTFEGRAWVGVTPFTMRNVRPEGLPAVPFLSDAHELNVRTYVHYDGVPGVWFFSLDASNPLAVLGATGGRLCQVAVDQEIAGPAHAGRAVDQLGDEPAVARVEARALQRRGQGQVGVGTLGVDAVEHVERHPAGGRRPGTPGRRARTGGPRPARVLPGAAGAAHVPRRSPDRHRTPLAQAAAGMRRRPSGWTSTR